MRTRTVIGTHHQLAVLLGHAEASGRLIAAGTLRPAPGQPGHYLVTVRIREPQRRQLTGTTPTAKPARSARRFGSGHRAKASSSASRSSCPGYWPCSATRSPKSCSGLGAHLIELLGGVALLVIVGALVAAAIDRCPTCGR